LIQEKLIRLRCFRSSKWNEGSQWWRAIEDSKKKPLHARTRGEDY